MDKKPNKVPNSKLIYLVLPLLIQFLTFAGNAFTNSTLAIITGFGWIFVTVFYYMKITENMDEGKELEKIQTIKQISIFMQALLTLFTQLQIMGATL